MGSPKTMKQDTMIAKQCLSPEQIKWASRHDWFVRSNGDGSIRVRGDVGEPETRDFRNFRSLCWWAGY